MFALGGILKLAGDLFALIGPLAIQQIVQYIEGLYAAAQAQAQVEAQSAAANRSILLGVGSTSSPMLGPNAATDSPADVVYYDDDDGGDDGLFNVAIGIGDVRIYYARWSDLLTNGWSIAWLVLVAALAQAALSQASTHVLNMTGIRIKTSLQGLIYRKSLLLNASSGCGNNGADVDDDDGDNPAAAVLQQNGNTGLTPNDKPAELAAKQQTERSDGKCLALVAPHLQAPRQSPSLTLYLYQTHSCLTEVNVRLVLIESFTAEVFAASDLAKCPRVIGLSGRVHFWPPSSCASNNEGLLPLGS